MATIRQASAEDIGALYAVSSAMGAAVEKGYFERCLSEQEAGTRRVFVAEVSGHTSAGPGHTVAGYVFLNFMPGYSPFRRFGIPEIQDLSVIPTLRQQGIGGRLIDHCVEAARMAGHAELGIGVGLHARFGAAQRLYVGRGFVPDGQGIVYDDEAVSAGELRPVDDLLALKMTKKL